jgi:hypothetical protein
VCPAVTAVVLVCRSVAIGRSKAEKPVLEYAVDDGLGDGEQADDPGCARNGDDEGLADTRLVVAGQTWSTVMVSSGSLAVRSPTGGAAAASPPVVATVTRSVTVTQPAIDTTGKSRVRRYARSVTVVPPSKPLARTRPTVCPPPHRRPSWQGWGSSRR